MRASRLATFTEPVEAKASHNCVPQGHGYRQLPMITLTDLLGWGSSLILLMTLMRQVYTQWRTRATAGLSRWLFVGQCTASIGYIAYSLRLHNWVYVSSNIAILLTAVLGEALYVHNRRVKREMS